MRSKMSQARATSPGTQQKMRYMDVLDQIWGCAYPLRWPWIYLGSVRFEKLEKTLVRSGEPKLAFECLMVKSKARNLANMTHGKERILIF